MNWRFLFVVVVSLAAAAGLFWFYGPPVAQSLIFVRPQRTATENDPSSAVLRAQQVVRASFPAAGLIKAAQVSETWGEREDSSGTWRVFEGTWELSEGQDPNEAARRLRSLVLASAPGTEIYIVPTERLDVEVRVYAATRLASHLHLQPTLSE